ncbi:MAG: hypothetical protein ACRC2T_03660, partial [Thermoguttaceae bacterium]
FPYFQRIYENFQNFREGYAQMEEGVTVTALTPANTAKILSSAFRRRKRSTLDRISAIPRRCYKIAPAGRLLFCNDCNKIADRSEDAGRLMDATSRSIFFIFFYFFQKRIKEIKE